MNDFIPFNVTKEDIRMMHIALRALKALDGQVFPSQVENRKLEELLNRVSYIRRFRYNDFTAEPTERVLNKSLVVKPKSMTRPGCPGYIDQSFLDDLPF